MHKSKIFIPILLSLVLVNSDAYSSVKALGMGDVQVAYPQEPTNAAVNPAILSDLGNCWEISALALNRDGTTTLKHNSIPGMNGKSNAFTFHTVPGGEGGFCIKLPYKLTAGVIAYGRDAAYKVKQNKIFPALGTSKLGLEIIGAAIGPFVSWQITPCMSIGIGMPYSLHRYRLKGAQNIRPFSVEPNHVSNRHYQYYWTIGPTFGWLYHLTPQLTLGASYRYPSKFSKVHKFDGAIAGHGKLHLPSIYRVGFAYNFCRFNLAADFAYQDWRHIRGAHNSQFSTAKPGSNKGFAYGINHIWTLAFGADWAYSEDLTLRTGYIYINGPTRRSQTGINSTFMAIVRNIVTVGATWKLNHCSELSIAWEHGFSQKMRGKTLSYPPGFGGGRCDLRERRDILGLSFFRYF